MLDLSHKKLDVYQLALKFVNQIYNLTKLFPKEEQFGLVSQLRRAAVSVASNLAEGASRKTDKDKQRFYLISRSSLVEIDTQLEISKLLSYMNTEQLTQIEQCGLSIFKMLSKMIDNLN